MNYNLVSCWKDFSEALQMLLFVSPPVSALFWRRGVVVTELVVSTKLLYVEPG